MNKFRDISYGAIIFMIIILIIILYFWYNDKDEDEKLKYLDKNKDGVVTKGELKYYLKWMELKKKKKQIRLRDLSRSVTSGFIRGLLMGLVFSDIEGGLVLGLMLGIINPILSSADKILFVANDN